MSSKIHTRDQALIERYRADRRKATVGKVDSFLADAIGACFALAWLLGTILVLSSLF